MTVTDSVLWYASGTVCTAPQLAPRKVRTVIRCELGSTVMPVSEILTVVASDFPHSVTHAQIHA